MDQERRDRATDWTGVVFGLAIALLAAYQQLKLPPVLPEMLDRFRYAPEMAGAFMSIFAVIGLAASVAVGKAMQRQSTAAWLIGGCGLIGLGAIPILLMPESGWAVLLGRGLEGMAMAILAVAGPTLMIRNAAPQHVPIAAALAATWIPLGGLAATLVAWAAEDLAASVAYDGKVFQAPRWPFVWWAGLLLAGLMAGWTAFLARRGGSRLALPTSQGGAPDLSASERRALTLSAGCFGLWALQNIAVLSWLPEYLVDDRGLATGTAQELYGLTVLTVAAANVGAAGILRAGAPIGGLLALVLGGQALVLLLGPLAATDWTGLLVLLAYGITAGITPTCIFGLPDALLGRGRTGPAAFGMLMTGRNLGVLTGPIAIGWIGAGALGWNAGWWVAAAAAACAAVAALAIHRNARNGARSSGSRSLG